MNRLCLGRLKAQRSVALTSAAIVKSARDNPKATGATVGGALWAISLSISLLIMPSEGLRTTAYLDKIAKPPVWTVCYGETLGIKPGMKFTVKQCEDMLYARVQKDFDKPLSQCFAAWTSKPAYWRAAVISWAYNVGTGAACNSTLRKKADAGDLKGACQELLKWDKAGGKRIKGLALRRSRELEVCAR